MEIPEFYIQNRVVEEEKEYETSHENSKGSSITQDPPTAHSKPHTNEDCFEFEAEPSDEVREQFEIMSIKMDIHKNGTLYLKELSAMLSQLPERQRQPISDFLVAYMKQTHKVTMPLPTFITNVVKAFDSNKFGLKPMFAASPELGLRDDDIKKLEKMLKKAPTNRGKKSQASLRNSKPPSHTRTRTAKNIMEQEKFLKKTTIIKPSVPVVKKLAKKESVKQNKGDNKYSKIAQKKQQSKAAPRSSYEKPTQAYMLRHKLNEFLSKEEVEKRIANTARVATEPSVEEFQDESPPHILLTPTEVPNKEVITSSPKRTAQPLQSKQRTTTEFFARSDSISEDAEIIYEEARREKGKRKGRASLSPSSSFLHPQSDAPSPRESFQKKGFLTKGVSFEAGWEREEKKPETPSIISSRNKNFGFNSKINLGGEDEIPWSEEEREFKERMKALALNDLRLSSESGGKATCSTRRNIFDIESQKRLKCVLKNGYSYKFQEKQQYQFAGTKDIPAKQDMALHKMLIERLEGSISPCLGCNESIVHRQESTSSLNSTWNILNDMLDDKSNPSKPTIEIDSTELFPIPSAEVKLNQVKANRMYRDLNMEVINFQMFFLIYQY